MKTTVDLKTILGLLVRSAIITYGGSLATSPQEVEVLSGGALILGGVVWSFLQKRLAAKKLAKVVNVAADQGVSL